MFEGFLTSILRGGAYDLLKKFLRRCEGYFKGFSKKRKEANKYLQDGIKEYNKSNYDDAKVQ